MIARIPTVEELSKALFSKSKRTMSNMRKEIKEQCLYISPGYRDFILKIINNNSIKIKHKSHKGSTLTTSLAEQEKESLKRRDILVITDLYDKDVLPHELGHAVDYWININGSFTTRVVLNKNKTLDEIFEEEFKSKSEIIYQTLMNEYKEIINSNINKEAFDVITTYLPKYQELFDVNTTYKQRKEIQKELYDSGFVETYYLLYKTKCFSILNKKYSPILDALSSLYNLDGYFLDHHSLDYYKTIDEKMLVQEFFANMFQAKITSQFSQFDNLKKFLPNSFNAFEQLFVILYDFVQNNKRFPKFKLRGFNNE